MGQPFWLSPKLHDFRGFRHAKTPKVTEFLKNRPIFEGKSLKMGTFLAKITLKDGYGFWGSSGTPLSNSHLSTPPDCASWRLSYTALVLCDIVATVMCNNILCKAIYRYIAMCQWYFHTVANAHILCIIWHLLNSCWCITSSTKTAG